MSFSMRSHSMPTGGRLQISELVRQPSQPATLLRRRPHRACVARTGSVPAPTAGASVSPTAHAPRLRTTAHCSPLSLRATSSPAHLCAPSMRETSGPAHGPAPARSISGSEKMDASRACAVMRREATARRRAGYLPRPWLAWQARRGTLVCTGPAAWKGKFFLGHFLA